VQFGSAWYAKTFGHGKAASFPELFERRLAWLGCPVRVHDSGRPRVAVLAGIAPDGALLLDGRHGREALTSGSISLATAVEAFVEG
jgi:biotin-(acetyl-CoA carboxylase) ligase